MAFYRNLSPLERSSYLAFEEADSSPRINQFILEGEGEFDLALLRKAVAQAAKVHPGSRLKLKGASKLSYWDDGGAPPNVVEHDASNWDAHSTIETDFFYPSMSFRDGPTVELVVLGNRNNNLVRLLARTHHAVMDGGGTVAFLKDVFRALRNEPLMGSNSNVADFDIFKQKDFGGGEFKADSWDTISAFGPPEGNSKKSLWRRISLSHSPSRALQKVALLIAKEAWSYQQGNVRLRIPVDLRRHLDSGTVTLANCTGAIDLDILAEDSERSLFKQMAKKLKANEELIMSRKLGLVSWAPIKMFRTNEQMIKRHYSRGLFQRTGTISHMGKVETADYSCPGFKVLCGYGVAPKFDMQSIYVGMWDSDQGLEVVCSSPEAFGGNGRLDKFVANVKENLI